MKISLSDLFLRWREYIPGKGGKGRVSAIPAEATLDELANWASGLGVGAIPSEYSRSTQEYDEDWAEWRARIEYRRFALGEARYQQVVEMAAQARAHYDADSGNLRQRYLACCLMLDVERVIRGERVA